MKHMKLLLLVLLILLVGCQKNKAETINEGIQITYASGDTRDYITDDITLTTEVSKTSITWHSSHEALLISGNVGAVSRDFEDINVTLTATFTYNKKAYRKTFELTIIKKEMTIDYLLRDVVFPEVVSEDVNLVSQIDGYAITWKSSNEAVFSNTGEVHLTTNDETIDLKAEVIINRMKQSKMYRFVVPKEVVEVNVLDSIELPLETTAHLQLPLEIEGITIVWSSNHEAISNSGVVNRSYEDITVTLTAQTTTHVKTFTVVVLKLEGVVSTKTPIKDAREQPLNTPLSIHAIVTSHMTDGNYTLEDTTGAIAVYFGLNQNDKLTVGHEYILSGTLSQFGGLLQLINPTIIEDKGVRLLPQSIDLSGYSLLFDDVTSYESYVVNYDDLEVIGKDASTNALTLRVKNQANEESEIRLDKRVNDAPFPFDNIIVGNVLNVKNLTVGQYNGKAQFLYQRRSHIDVFEANLEVIKLYGYGNKTYIIGDEEPNYLQGITAKNGYGADFTSDLTYQTNANLTVSGNYEVSVYLNSNPDVKVTYTLFVRKETQAGVYEGYYQSLSGLSGAAFNAELKRLIKTSGFATGSTSQVQTADRWQGSYYLIYTGLGSYGNREHTWPKSLLGSAPKDDLHNLRAAKNDVNSMRSNYPFIEDSKPFTGSQPYALIGGGFYPGDEHIGDVARIILYIHVRYGLNLNVVGNLEMFLNWHLLDPVNDFEKTRNDRIHSIQNNRNPFIDHPELVDIYFSNPS